MGRFNPELLAKAPKPDSFAEEAALISPGQRCEIGPPPNDSAMDEDTSGMVKRRGTVKYVGQVAELKAGWWIGIEYDEPIGKHDGTWVCAVLACRSF